MRFKKGPQLPGAGRASAGHHHGSHTPTSPEAVLLHSSLLWCIDMSNTVPVKSKGEISQNFVAFSEYINFNFLFPRSF